jgi:hypothetical protein
MEEDKKRKGRVVYHGMFPDDHPFYTRAGWNFLLAPNLPKRTPERDDGDGDEHKGVDG